MQRQTFNRQDLISCEPLAVRPRVGASVRPLTRRGSPAVVTDNASGSSAAITPVRRAITLFEVVLALAIFLGAFAAIGQVLRTGTVSAVRAQLASTAALRCERVMNDVLAGVLPMQSVTGIPFEDDTDWVYSVNVLESGTPSLMIIETVVERTGTTSQSAIAYRLTRMIRDPQIYLDAATGMSEDLP